MLVIQLIAELLLRFRFYKFRNLWQENEVFLYRWVQKDASELLSHPQVMVHDPVPMTLTRLANRERAQLLIESAARPALQAFLRDNVRHLDITGVDASEHAVRQCHEQPRSNGTAKSAA